MKGSLPDIIWYNITPTLLVETQEHKKQRQRTRTRYVKKKNVQTIHIFIFTVLVANTRKRQGVTGTRRAHPRFKAGKGELKYFRVLGNTMDCLIMQKKNKNWFYFPTVLYTAHSGLPSPFSPKSSIKNQQEMVACGQTTDSEFVLFSFRVFGSQSRTQICPDPFPAHLPRPDMDKKKRNNEL